MIAARTVVVALLLAASSQAARADEVSLFRDWIRARCVAVAAGDTAFGRDAAASAGAYVEKGSLPATAYEAGERLITAALAKPLAGTRDVRYDTLKCLDLAASREIGRLAGRAKAGKS